jgi:ABC-2 type transport system ATP-binding protein/lipopolysaccharide transport system ATP-binding protein
MESALILENVTVSYPVRRAAGGKGASRALQSAYFSAPRHDSVDVLKNIWLTLKDGDRIGIIGRNGSGKSTLLRTMAGIYAPTTGRMWTRGRVAPIFSSSAGFAPQATGYENIFLRGMLIGISRADIEARIDQICAFADIGDWMHQPISTYSSGMTLRIAFAITTCMRPNILLVDEWIGAGDALFMKRAGERLEELIASANILAVATHANAILKRFCSRGIVMDRGVIMFEGGVDDALAYYSELVALSEESGRDARPDSPSGEVAFEM